MHPGSCDKIIGHAGRALCWKLHSGCSKGCDVESDRFCILRINIEQDVVLFIISVYLPPANSNIADFGVILDQLKEIVLSLREMGHLCVIGDFNAQLGKDAGQRAASTEWTKNGKLLYNMMQRCSLISADLTSTAVGPKYTFQRLGATGQSYIDHCLISMELMPYVLSCGVMEEDPSNFSDHLPVFIKISKNICPPQTGKNKLNSKIA